MRRCLDLRLLVILLIPFAFAFAPHDGGDSGKNIGNSAPPGVGGDGPWESQNMILLGRLDLGQIGAVGANVMGNDCWGWTDSQTGKEYAICGLTNATSFVDITNPANPQYLGQLPTQTGNAAWRDMKVFNDHVFVVSDGNGDHGMQIFDLTELRTADPNNPSTFTNTAWYDDGTGSCHNIAINEDTGFAYLVGSDHANASGGLQVVNINNPTNPVAAGEFSADGYTHDCQVVTYNGPDADYNGKEIAFCCNEDTVTIVDVDNKSNMTQISRNGYAQDSYTHQGWLSDDHRFFYMGDELDESNFGGLTRTHVFDCLDLDNPVYRGFYSGETNAIDHNLYVKGDRVYCGNYASGLRILEQDSADPGILTEIAYFDSYPVNTGANFDGVWSVYPYFASGTILINDRQGGMFLVKTSPISIEIPNGMPSLIDPAGVVEFNVLVADFDGTAAPGTGMLHVDVGDGQGFKVFPMSEISPGEYEARFPATDCGTLVNYFVSAEGTNGEMLCVPSTAPTIASRAFSAKSLTETFYEDFEATSGWTISGDATDGQWELGVPAGAGDRGDPANDSDGSGSCYLTDNESGNSDVDGGHTILVSSPFDATPGLNQIALLSYDRWYSNSNGGSPAADIFVIDISNDGGKTWVNVETVGPTGEVSGGWIKNTIRVSDFVTPNNNIQLRFDVSDLGGGSVVEAGIDALQVRQVECAKPVEALGFKRLDGVTSSGGITELASSDDLRYEISPTPTSNLFKQKIDVVFISELDNPNLESMGLRLEAIVNGGPSGDVLQEIQMFNETTGNWDLIDSRPATGTEYQIEVTPVGAVTDYIHPITSEITSRLTWTSEDFPSGTPFVWDVNIDRKVWMVIEN